MEHSFEELDKQIMDVDELKGLDIKINPDYYIHMALLKAQNALSQDNVKEGFMKFRMIVEHIEMLCSSAGMITESFDKDIVEFKNSVEYKEAEDLVKPIKLANKKLHLIMTKVFKNKTLTAPLRY